MANSNNWGEIYKSTWWGDKAWSANTLFIDSAPPGFGLNLLKASEDMNITLDWSQTLISVAANSTDEAAPNGTDTAEKLTFTDNRQSRIQQQIALEANTTYTFSVYAKVRTGTQSFRLRNVTLGQAQQFTADTSWGLNPDDGRYSFSFTTGATAITHTLSIQNAATAGTGEVFFWGAMLNEGATAGDYVKTDASVGGSAPTPAYSGFGDAFGGAAAYYSLRKFTEAETLNAIRVRRSSDDTEQDIGFDANGDLDTAALLDFVQSGKLWDTATDGNLTYTNRSSVENNQSIGGRTGVQKFTSTDTNAFFGQTNVFPASDTNSYTIEVDVYLPTGQDVNGIRTTQPFTSSTQTITQGEWTTITISGTNSSSVNFVLNMLDDGSNAISAGQVVYVDSVTITQTTADGAVTTFYDQSGNGNDATNSTESEQPLVVSGGTLVEENGKAAVQFDGSDDYLAKIATLTINGDHMISAVHTPEGVGGYLFSLGYNDLESVLLWNNATNYSRYWLSGSGDQLNSAETVAGQRLTTGEFASGTQTLYIDGSQNSTKSTTYSGGDVPDITIGYAVQRAQGSNYLIGKVQELIFFNSDQSANRTGIETNINDHFSIYP